MKVVTLHWSALPLKALGAFTEKHGPIETAGLQILEGRYDGAQVRSYWYDQECKRREGDPASVAQELDIGYLTSGYPVFSPEWARSHLEAVQEPLCRTQPVVLLDGPEPAVSHQERPDGEFWWFEDLELCGEVDGGVDGERVLCCGVDSAEGLGNQDSDPDYSAIVIWDPATGQPVGCFRSRVVAPQEVAAILADLAKRLNLLIVIERNGPGLAVIATLAGWLTGYRQDAQVFYPLRYADMRGVSERQPGFRTTPDSKHQLIELIRYHTKPELGTLLDRRLVDEYTLFSHLAGRKQGAPPGAHDDLVMALGLALVTVKDAELWARPAPRIASPDAVMVDLAQDVLDGRITDEAMCEQLGIR